MSPVRGAHRRTPTRLGAAATLAWGLLCALLLGGCSLIRLGDIEPPEGRRVIVAIEIEGADGVAEGDIVAELESQVQGLSVPAEDALVDMAEIGIDARRIESIYAAYGYFRARVTNYRVVEGTNSTATVIYEVDEGPPTKVVEMAFVGLHPERLEDEGKKRLEEARAEFDEVTRLNVGDVWNEADYLRGLDDLARILREKGFAHVAVAGDNYVSRQRNEVAVYYRIRHGPLTRISEIRVVGNKVVPTERILRRVPVEIGDITEPEALRTTEQYVYDLGMFFSVQTRVIRSRGENPGQEDAVPTTGSASGTSEPSGVGDPLSGAAPIIKDAAEKELESGADSAVPGSAEEEAEFRRLPKLIPVEVVVQETPEWEFSVGVGFTTDLAQTELRLPVSFQERNLWEDLHKLRILLAPKLIFPDVSVTSGDARLGWETQLTYTIPSFFEELLAFEASARYDRDASQDVGTDELGASIGLSRPITRWLTARIGANVAFFRYFDSSAVSNLSAAEAYDESLLIFGDQDIITYLDTRLVLDLRDGLYDARSGFYTALSADFALPIISDIEYIRLLADVRGYIYLSPLLTLALRARVGHNFFPQSQGTPQPARFLGGGQASNRGFGSNQMGDYICGEPIVNGAGRTEYINVRCGDGLNERTYVGGNYFWDTSTELRFYLSDLWGFVLFADIGQLWSRPDQVSFSDLAVAVGPGARLFTPVGPVRVDLGFLIIGEDALAFQFHFSLGQAF